MFNRVCHWYEAISFIKGVLPSVIQSPSLAGTLEQINITRIFINPVGVGGGGGHLFADVRYDIPSRVLFL